MKIRIFFLAGALSLSSHGFAADMEHSHPMGPMGCSQMEVWDYNMAMCMPLAMKDMPMKMLMLQTNSFGVQTVEEKPRGRNAFS
ncbi:MAG: hypothetical protein ACXVA9_12465, partial [Bdellovibrionales bacterium]